MTGLSDLAGVSNGFVNLEVRRAKKAKSKISAHVEHVFARPKDRMDLFICKVGRAKAMAKIGLANLVSNVKRLISAPDRTGVRAPRGAHANRAPRHG